MQDLTPMSRASYVPATASSFAASTNAQPTYSRSLLSEPFTPLGGRINIPFHGQPMMLPELLPAVTRRPRPRSRTQSIDFGPLDAALFAASGTGQTSQFTSRELLDEPRIDPTSFIGNPISWQAQFQPQALQRFYNAQENVHISRQMSDSIQRPIAERYPSAAFQQLASQIPQKRPLSRAGHFEPAVNSFATHKLDNFPY